MLGEQRSMKQDTIEHDVDALWIQYSVVEKMTWAYSDCIKNWAGDAFRRMIPADLEEITAQILRGKQEDRWLK